MSGTTYSRTDGHAILPGTWAYVRSRGDVPQADILPAHLRFDYDICSVEQKHAFVRQASMPLTTPPDFLRFALAAGQDALESYPGATSPERGHAAGGALIAVTEADCADEIGISVDHLRRVIGTFSGEVHLIEVKRGITIYRSVGLTANHAAAQGAVTNVLLGRFWDTKSPNAYASEAEWRAHTAVLAEWNGDYGHLKVTLARPIKALSGLVGMQKLPRQGSAVLPGGGHQIFISHLDDADLVVPIGGRPLVEIIQPTQFGSHARR